MSKELEKGRILYEQRRYEDALAMIETHLSREPEDGRALTQLALCQYHLGLYSEASDTAERAISCDPTDCYPYSVAASIFHRRKLLDRALVRIEDALAYSPLQPGYLALAGMIYFDLEEWDRALLLVEEALAQEPMQLDALNTRARLLLRVGRGDEARRSLEAALSQDPEEPWTLANLGWLELQQKRGKEAESYFRSALAIEPEMEWAREGLLHSLRSKFPVYGLVLSYFFWLEKHSAEIQRQIVIASMVGARVLRLLVARYPALAVVLGPLLLVWRVFSYITWTVRAATTLLLRCSGSGRMLLTRDEVVESNIVGGLWAALAVIWGYHYFVDPFTLVGKIGPYVLISLTMLVEPCFSLKSSLYRRIARGANGVLAGLGLGGLVLAAFGMQLGITFLIAYFRALAFVFLGFQLLHHADQSAPIEDEERTYRG